MLVTDNNSKINISNIDNQIKAVQGILNIYSTLNNTIFTFTDLSGNTIYCYSCGSIPNLKKGLRSKYLTITEAFDFFLNKLIQQNIKYIYIKLKGIGLIRKIILKSLKKKNLKVLKILNITPVPHNGCRAKKYRRI